MSATFDNNYRSVSFSFLLNLIDDRLVQECGGSPLDGGLGQLEVILVSLFPADGHLCSGLEPKFIQNYHRRWFLAGQRHLIIHSFTSTLEVA